MTTYNNIEYIKLVEGFENSEALKFEIAINNQKAFIHFIKRDIANELNFLPKNKYFDLITPFDYGGIYYTDIKILPYFFKELGKWSQMNRIISMFIRFNPCKAFNYKAFSNFMDIKKIGDLIYINLKHDFWKNYSRGRKSDINRVKKLNYNMQKTTIEMFYPLYIQTMKRNNASRYFYFKKEILQDLEKKGFIRVFGIYLNNELISSIIVLDDFDVSYYYLGGSKDDALSLDLNAMLLHEVALLLKKEGKKIFFLGGGRKGVHNFKKRFSKDSFPYYVGMKIFDREIYDKLISKTQRENNDFFPKYREKIV